MNPFKKNGSDEKSVDRNQIFAVYDEKAQSYGLPLTHATVSVAIRSFTAACQNPQSFLSQFSSDYSLYHIGTYDEISARIVSFTEPRFVIRASEVVKPVVNLMEVSNAKA